MDLNSTYIGINLSVQTMNFVSFAVSLFGLIFSVILTIISAIVETDYRFLVLNLALIDVLYGFGRCLSGVLIFFPSYTGMWCKVDGFLFWYGKAASNTALFPLTVNRLIAVFVHDYFLKISSKRFVLSIIAVVDGLVLLCMIPICFVYGRLGREKVGADCSIQMDQQYASKFLIFAAVYFIVVIPLSIVQFAMNGVVFCAVSRHKNMLEAARYEYKETREIVIALLFQTATPIFIQWPFIAVVCYEIFDPAIMSVSNWTYFVTKDLHGIGPVLNSLFLFAMVKPYRRVLLFWIKTCCSGLLKKTKKGGSAVIILAKMRPIVGISMSGAMGASVNDDDKRSTTGPSESLEQAHFQTASAARK